MFQKAISPSSGKCFRMLLSLPSPCSQGPGLVVGGMAVQKAIDQTVSGAMGDSEAGKTLNHVQVPK